MKGSGQMGPAMERINHYFTPFQAHVVGQADRRVDAMDQALTGGGEAKFKAVHPRTNSLRISIRGHLTQPFELYQGLAAMAGHATARTGSGTS